MSMNDLSTIDCFVCRKHRGEIVLPGGAVYEDEQVYAGHIYNEKVPTYLGYLMAELKRHAPGLADRRRSRNSARRYAQI